MRKSLKSGVGNNRNWIFIYCNKKIVWTEKREMLLIFRTEGNESNVWIKHLIKTKEGNHFSVDSQYEFYIKKLYNFKKKKSKLIFGFCITTSFIFRRREFSVNGIRELNLADRSPESTIKTTLLLLFLKKKWAKFIKMLIY